MKKTIITAAATMFLALMMNSVKAHEECSAILDTECRHNPKLRAVTPTLPESNAAVTVDVLIVYTPAAKEWTVQNGEDMDNLIEQSILRSNLVLSNSQTGVTLRLAYKQEVDYTETSNPNTDLSRLRNPQDGYADEAHALRTRYNADVVVMLIGEAATNGVLGAGYIPSDEWGNAKSAFSVVQVKTLTDGYTLIHEIGHNFGCGHHTDTDKTALYNYAHGYKGWSDEGHKFSTVMSYENTNGVIYPRIPYFSDENLSFEGTSIGSSTANNAKTIRQFKSVVAAYSNEIAFTDAFLQDITLSSGTLSPAFNAGTYNYTVNVDYGTEYIDVEGIKNSSYASVSGNVSAMPLNVGDNAVEIKVTDGWQNYEKTYTLTIRRASVITDINETGNDMIKILPNPVLGELRIESGELKVNKAEICNISGKSVAAYPANNAAIDVSSLAQGIYLLRLETDGGVIVKKFVKK